MSDVAITTSTPIAPAHPAGMGASTPGGHIKAFRAQAAFPVEAKITITGNSPWRPGTPGHRFYEEVLAKGPATVGAAIEMAGALAEPFSVTACQGHLRWLYTSAGGFLEVDGQRFSAPERAVKVEKPKAVKPVEPVKAPRAKKSKKAEAKEVEEA